MKINGAQAVKLEKGTIRFKNLYKQILVPFKIYSNFEYILNSVESYEVSCPKKYQGHIPCSFAYKLVCVDNEFNKSIAVFRDENAAFRFISFAYKLICVDD